MNRSKYTPDPDMTNYKSLELPECVFLSERCRCAILNVKICMGEKCTFRKTAYDIEKSEKICREHLNTLDMTIQNKIADNYYGGKKPWRRK